MLIIMGQIINMIGAIKAETNTKIITKAKTIKARTSKTWK